jgi:nitric oxide reductase subunit C
MLSKSQARGFFLGGTALSFAVFLGLSWNTLSVTVPKQTKRRKYHARGDSR